MSAPDPKADAFTKRQSSWRDEIAALRSIALSCGLDESLKWGKPCYAHGDKNVAIIQPFKGSVALMFFRGAIMKDPKGILVEVGPNSQAAKRVEFTSMAEVKKHAPTLKAYIKEACVLVDDGIEVDFVEKTELTLPDELLAAFKKNKPLEKAFKALTPGRQRAYVLNINGAKQSATKTARVEKFAPRILEGKGLND